MEIKVNDYVRIKDGDIGKIKEDGGEFIKYYVGTLYGKDLDRICLNSEVLKSSPNIGKLLKVGDFIDGLRIVEIDDTTIHALGGWFIDVNDVEDLVTSIVTKEMFEQMEYKID